ncbi:MAG: DUF790 family protein [Pirellula sp.]
MLTRELAIATYERGHLVPDRLHRLTHASYLLLATAMLDVYRHGVGKTRKALHAEVRDLFPFSDEHPPRRILAFCKLLDEAAEFDTGDGSKTAMLRQSVFRSAAKHHPLVVVKDTLFGSQVGETQRLIAQEHGMDWSELRMKLFADLIENHRLKSFEGFENAERLLARYNVAQAQVALFDAVHLTVIAKEDFKSILRFAKLARLMHRIEKRADGYVFVFDGPASLLHATHRYGTAMAKFLPGLLSCTGWRMRAALRSRFQTSLRFELDDRCGLTSDAKVGDEYDSTVEAAFAHRWGAEPRDGWTLERETEILHRGQIAFFPDFVFKHSSGFQAAMEVIGFWTQEYLTQKSSVLSLFRDTPILLVIAHSVKDKLPDLSGHPVLEYKNTISVDAVFEALESMRTAVAASLRDAEVRRDAR